MNERVFVLREAVVKITQMLAGKGIKVTQRGISAYVQPGPNGEPELVNLPYLPDNASDELCHAIQGFLDHEVAHILFTDFKAMGKITDQGLHNMVNIIEDTRIEREMAKRFAGSGHNIAVTGQFFIDKYVKPQIKEAARKGDANGVKALVMVPVLRAMSGQQVFKEFLGNNPDLVAAIADEQSKIEHLASRIEGCATTTEAIEVAAEVLKALGRETGGEEGGGTSKAPPKPKGGKGSKGGKSMGKPGGKPEDEEGEEAEDGSGSSGGKPGDEDEEDAGSGSGEGEGEDEEEDEGESETDGESEEESDAENEDEGAEDPEPVENDGHSSAFLDALDKETANGFDETMSQLITDSATDAAKGAEYLVFSKDWDVIEPLHIGRDFNPAMTKRLADDVDHMVAPLQKDLERAISARSLAVWENGRRSGRIHAGNLSRLAVGDSRVFRKKHESTSKDVAVELVIDMSGSMSGEKIHTAAKAGYALASVLDRLNIKSECICFTTGEVPDWGAIEKDAKKLGREFTRVESLYMPILKSFNERMQSTEVRNRFAWLPHCSTLRNNVDGECVEIAARRLLARREAGKIMIVLSDGQPAFHGGYHEGRKHLKETVQKIEASGVRVVGIGIQSDATRGYYHRHMQINNVSELPSRVMKELRALLLA
ncbi:cobaltochelatase CobT-related protein [Paraburkholderia sp.]|uniref:cobaltochelatase CobT-related protein n=1 Tax=Paraburkholderia sp. TaxID=1926495 RepID=UPI0039E4078E